MAEMAWALSDPKDMADTFTTDRGRNACRRPRGPPSTLAHGSVSEGSSASEDRGATSENVRCLTTGYVEFSTSLSVPNPK